MPVALFTAQPALVSSVAAWDASVVSLAAGLHGEVDGKGPVATASATAESPRPGGSVAAASAERSVGLSCLVTAQRYCQDSPLRAVQWTSHLIRFPYEFCERWGVRNQVISHTPNATSPLLLRSVAPNNVELKTSQLCSDVPSCLLCSTTSTA